MYIFDYMVLIRRQNKKCAYKSNVMVLNVRDWYSIYYQSLCVTEQKPPWCHFVTSQEI